jgi:hypothetical protein
MQLSINNRVEIVLIMGENRTARETANIFHARHPDIPKPSHTTISRLFRKFKDHGSVLQMQRNVVEVIT